MSLLLDPCQCVLEEVHSDAPVYINDIVWDMICATSAKNCTTRLLILEALTNGKIILLQQVQNLLK